MHRRVQPPLESSETPGPVWKKTVLVDGGAGGGKVDDGVSAEPTRSLPSIASLHKLSTSAAL